MKKSLNSKVDVHFNVKLIQRPFLQCQAYIDFRFNFLLFAQMCMSVWVGICVFNPSCFYFLLHLLQKSKIFQSHREIKWKQKTNRRNQSVFNFDCSCIFTGPWWWNEWEIPFDIRSICISFHCCFDWFTCKT